jgi:hypothetical protein
MLHSEYWVLLTDLLTNKHACAVKIMVASLESVMEGAQSGWGANAVAIIKILSPMNFT